MTDFSAMMKQAQAMQAKLQDAQAKMAETTADGSSGGGMVGLTLKGAGELTSLRIDPSLLVVARTLGASPARVFFGVAIPLARAGLAGGAALAWARALGEFGATLMFAGNFTGRTQTLPLAIYTALESNLDAAKALSLVLVMVAFGLLLLLRARDPVGARPASDTRPVVR